MTLSRCTQRPSPPAPASTRDPARLEARSTSSTGSPAVSEPLLDAGRGSRQPLRARLPPDRDWQLRRSDRPIRWQDCPCRGTVVRSVASRGVVSGVRRFRRVRGGGAPRDARPVGAAPARPVAAPLVARRRRRRARPPSRPPCYLQLGRRRRRRCRRAPTACGSRWRPSLARALVASGRSRSHLPGDRVRSPAAGCRSAAVALRAGALVGPGTVAAGAALAAGGCGGSAARAGPTAAGARPRGWTRAQARGRRACAPRCRRATSARPRLRGALLGLGPGPHPVRRRRARRALLVDLPRPAARRARAPPRPRTCCGRAPGPAPRRVSAARACARPRPGAASPQAGPARRAVGAVAGAMLPAARRRCCRSAHTSGHGTAPRPAATRAERPARPHRPPGGQPARDGP